MGNSCCSSDGTSSGGYREVNTQRNEETVDLTNDIRQPLHICYKINGTDLKILESKNMYESLSSHSKASLINFGKRATLTDSFLFILLIRWRYVIDDIINDRLFNSFDGNTTPRDRNIIIEEDTKTRDAGSPKMEKGHERRNSKLSLVQQLLSKPFKINSNITINFANYIGETKLLPNISLSEIAQSYEILGETYFYRFINDDIGIDISNSSSSGHGKHNNGPTIPGGGIIVRRLSSSYKSKRKNKNKDKDNKDNKDSKNSKLLLSNNNSSNNNRNNPLSMLDIFISLDIITNKHEKEIEIKKFESLTLETINDLKQRIIEKEIEFCEQYWQKSKAVMDEHYGELRNGIIKLSQQIEMIKYVTPILIDKEKEKRKQNNNNNNRINNPIAEAQ